MERWQLKESLQICEDVQDCVKNKLNPEQEEQILRYKNRWRFFDDLGEVSKNDKREDN